MYTHKFASKCHSQTTPSSECSNHHPSLSILRPKGLSRSMMKWWVIYTHLPVNAIVRLPHPRSGDSQGQETFLAPSADKQTCNYDTKCSNQHPSLTIQRLKGLSCSMMKWWAIYTNLPVNAIVRLPHPRSGDSQGQETFSAPSADKQIRNYVYIYIYICKHTEWVSKAAIFSGLKTFRIWVQGSEGSEGYKLLETRNYVKRKKKLINTSLQCKI